jgi:thiol-disulfide isomerase/thioredoxin
MSPVVKGLLVSGTFVIAAAALWLGVSKDIKREAPPPEGYSLLTKFEAEGVPDFSAPFIKQGLPTGIDMKLSEYKGKIIILSFWATWCSPCVEEFPTMIALLEKFKGEVVMVGVSADQKPSDIEYFLKTYKLDSRFFVNLWDPSTDIAAKYGTFKIPENYIIGRDFKLLKKVAAVQDWNTPEVISYFEGVVKNGK